MFIFHHFVVAHLTQKHCFSNHFNCFLKVFTRCLSTLKVNQKKLKLNLANILLWRIFLQPMNTSFENKFKIVCVLLSWCEHFRRQFFNSRMSFLFDNRPRGNRFEFRIQISLVLVRRSKIYTRNSTGVHFFGVRSVVFFSFPVLLFIKYVSIILFVKEQPSPQIIPKKNVRDITMAIMFVMSLARFAVICHLISGNWLELQFFHYCINRNYLREIFSLHIEMGESNNVNLKYEKRIKELEEQLKELFSTDVL